MCLELPSIFPLIVAIALAFATQRALEKHFEKRKSVETPPDRRLNPEAAAAARDAIGRVFSTIAISGLLPLVFLETVYRNPQMLTDMGEFVGYGFAFAGGTLIIANWICQNFSRDRQRQWLDITSATFGGGNRGIILISMAAPLLAIINGGAVEVDAYLSYFVAFDFGNFVLLVLVIPFFIVNRLGRTDADAEAAPTSVTAMALDSFRKAGLPALVIVVLTPVFFLLGDTISAHVLPILEHTSGLRRFLLVYFSFTTIVLNSSILQSRMSAVFDYTLSVMALRLPVLLAAGAGAYALSNPARGWLVLTHPLVIAATTLFLSPPSSLLPAYVEKLGAPAEVRAHVSNASMTYFAVYFIALGLAFFGYLLLTIVGRNLC